MEIARSEVRTVWYVVQNFQTKRINQGLSLLSGVRPSAYAAGDSVTLNTLTFHRDAYTAATSL